MRITIVGGGAAGWISAALLDNAKHDVTLIESPNIPIMGVGESTLPFIKRVFDKIGLKESEWLPKCNGIIKHGNVKHNFKSIDDKPFMWGFVYDSDRYVNTTRETFNDKLDDYAYHIAAEELPAIIKGSCPNVTHIIKEITERPECDLLIDCTGQRQTFIEDKTWIQSPKHIVNAAWVCSYDKEKLGWTGNSTRSYAMKYGWEFYIPLANRVGCGYIFSSFHVDTEDALLELNSQMKGNTQLDEPRLIRWSPGYLKNMWSGNTVGIGMGSIFIEPLESNALAHIQTSVEILIKCLSKGYSKKTYNKMIHTLVKQTSDAITSNYALTERNDTDFWTYYHKYKDEMTKRIDYYYSNNNDYKHNMYPSSFWAGFYHYFGK
jgi:hypothetical protein